MVKINEKYKALGSDSKYFIVTGGRGSGKSFAINIFLCLLTYEAGHVILFTRYTLTSANASIIPEFLEKIEILGRKRDFYITKDEIINKKTGSKIIFKGLKTSSGDQTANLKSLQGITTWILDETEELTDEKLFKKIDRSIRKKGIQNRVILVMNPPTKEHFVHKRFFLGKSVNGGSNITKGNITYIHTTYLDNLENLNEEFIQDAEETKLLNPAEYESDFLGVWRDKAEGVIYNYELGEFKDPLKVVRYGMDFGYNDPTTCIAVAVDRDTRTAYLKEVFYKNKTLVEDVWVQIREEVNGSMIIADSAKKDDIERLRWLGANIYPCYKGGGIDGSSIMPGIKSVKKWKLVVDPNSLNLIKELNEYCFDTRKSDYPIDKWNHGLDAVRYVLYDLEISGIC